MGVDDPISLILEYWNVVRLHTSSSGSYFAVSDYGIAVHYRWMLNCRVWQ